MTEVTILSAVHILKLDGDNNRFRLLQRAMGNDSNSRLTTAGITFNGLT
jgi:hypothetical protein